MTDERTEKDYVVRKSERKQKAINIFGGILVGCGVYAFTSSWNFLKQMDLTVQKVDLALERIEHTNNVSHKRDNKLDADLDRVDEMAIRADERSQIIWQYLCAKIK